MLQVLCNVCQVTATTGAETHVYTFDLNSSCCVLCFLVEFCSGILFLDTKRVSRGAGRCAQTRCPAGSGSDPQREAGFSPREPGPAAAPQRHPVAAGFLP